MTIPFRLLAASLLAALPLCLGTLPVRAQDAGEMMIRLDRLESANRQLTGQVEEARNQIRRLEDQLHRMQADVDFRFQDLQGKGGKPPVRSAPPAADGKRSDAFNPAVQPQAPGAPQPLGATASIRPLPGGPSAPGGSIIVDDASRGPGPGDPLPLGGAATPGRVPGPQVAALPGGNPADDLALAKGFLQRGDYELAEGQYRAFLRGHPHDRMEPEAQFGLAETYFLRQRYQEAAEQYLNLATQHPQASLAPEGLLKLAMSLRAIGEKQQACGTLSEITRKYPHGTAGLKMAVQREQKRSRC